MLIGLDFDNTIVCYDKAIARLADELPDLPSDLPRTKLALRSFLRNANRELEWTAFQGKIYGPGMAYAEPFEQALETMQALREMGHVLCIVSHRTFRPYAGPKYDLHDSALSWVNDRLISRGFIDREMAYFTQTRSQKIALIERFACAVFLDDLPEVLLDTKFPQTCKPILFDPQGVQNQSEQLRIKHWAELPALVVDSI